MTRRAAAAAGCGWCAVLFAIVLPAQGQRSALSGYDLQADDAVRWRLPRQLTEISGLATAAGDRVFAHDDERGIIYQIDYREGRFVKAFSLGNRPVRDDFEGLAYVDERFYLVTSTGTIYEAREGEDDDRMLFNTYGTGVGARCEVEGLAFEPADRTLLLLCKAPRDKALDDVVAIFRWSLDRREMASSDALTVPLSELTTPANNKNFSPSGIERHPRTGHYLIVAAAQSVIAEITPAGEVLAVQPLPKGRHRQAEGITITSDLTLFVADEGGNGRARLTLYPPR